MSLADAAIPQSAYDLIRLLDRTVPARCIRLGEDPIAAHRYAGSRELVEELVAMMNEELHPST